MTWQLARAEIPLSYKPSIVHMGCAIHGHRLIERYRLPKLWSIHIYRYDAELVINGVPYPIRPGHASIIPADTPMEYRYRGRSPHVYAHFTAGPGKSVPIPIMQDLGLEYERLYRSMEDAVGWFSNHRLRAEIRLWDVLWQLATRQTAGVHPPRQIHPAVEQTYNEIERNLAGPLYVGDLARHAGLSQNHLTRLFRAASGVTVSAYIRDRRVQRALHFLRHTTIPIKEIAVEVGLPDLNFFNKTVRRVTGSAPRKLRLG
jgi:AraC-like DNA-binding protein